MTPTQTRLISQIKEALLVSGGEYHFIADERIDDLNERHSRVYLQIETQDRRETGRPFLFDERQFLSGWIGKRGRQDLKLKWMRKTRRVKYQRYSLRSV